MLGLEGGHNTVLEDFALVESIKGEPQFNSSRLVPYVREPETSPSKR
jgi:hypothetical protein